MSVNKKVTLMHTMCFSLLLFTAKGVAPDLFSTSKSELSSSSNLASINDLTESECHLHESAKHATLKVTSVNV